jgi:hypothetical protein
MTTTALRTAGNKHKQAAGKTIQYEDKIGTDQEVQEITNEKYWEENQVKRGKVSKTKVEGEDSNKLTVDRQIQKEGSATRKTNKGIRAT